MNSTLTHYLICVMAVIALPHFLHAQSDSTQATSISYSTTKHDFGRMEFGTQDTAYVVFTNTGNAPLRILDCSSNTGSLVPTYPTQPVMPGDSGMIMCSKHANKLGPFDNKVWLLTSARESTVTLHFTGEVLSVYEMAKQDTIAVTPPTFYTDSLHYDIGTFHEGDLIRRNIHFTNKGFDDLVVKSCQTSCGCDLCMSPSGPIPTDGPAVLVYEYDSNRVGPIKSAMTITTNDPARPVVVVQITGQVLPR